MNLVSSFFGTLINLIEWAWFSADIASAFGLEPRPLSRTQLKKMSRPELETAYAEDYGRLLAHYKGDSLITGTEAYVAEAKCICFFEELSLRKGGAYGPAFKKAFKRQLRKELRAKAREAL